MSRNQPRIHRVNNILDTDVAIHTYQHGSLLTPVTTKGSLLGATLRAMTARGSLLDSPVHPRTDSEIGNDRRGNFFRFIVEAVLLSARSGVRLRQLIASMQANGAAF